MRAIKQFFGDIIIPVYFISWGLFVVFDLTHTQFHGCAITVIGILLLIAGFNRFSND